MTLPLTPARALGARPDLVAVLRSDVTDYGRNPIWLPPARRRKRGALTPEDLAEGVVPIATPPTAPVVRLWPFQLAGSVIATRTTIVSQAFSGPLYLVDAWVRLPSLAGALGGLSLFAATDSGGAQTNGADTRPTGDAIFEPGTFGGSTFDTDTIDENLSQIAFVASADGEFLLPLSRFIPLSGSVFLKWSVLLSGVASGGAKGYVRLVENADPANLPAVR